MAASAPRLSLRLLEAIDRIDDPRRPIAETARRVCVEAERLGLARPSYQQIRVHVHASRQLSAPPGAAEVLLDVALRLRPPEDLYRLSEGTLPPRRS
jgi:hypothetical protein